MYGNMTLYKSNQYIHCISGAQLVTGLSKSPTCTDRITQQSEVIHYIAKFGLLLRIHFRQSG